MHKEINIKTFFIIISILAIAEIIIVCLVIPGIQASDLKKHCEKAVCNDDYTVCFNYEDKGSDTNITWRGNCSKVK